MRLGYFTLADNAPSYGERRRDAGELIRGIVEQVALAERLGFSSAWVPEHHGPGFGMLPTPGAMLGYLAARTRRVRLGAACVVLPLNQPLRIAEEYATLDQLSGGRISVAFGRGFDEAEYRGYGVDFARSRELLREGVELVQRAWIERPLTFSGEHYAVSEPFELNQYPLQRPHPEIWIALWSRGTLELAAQLGHNALLTPFAANLAFGGLRPAVEEMRRLAKAAGHGRLPRVGCSYYCAVAARPRDVSEHRERLLRLLRGLVPNIPTDRSSAPPNLRYFVDIAEKIERMSADDLGDSSIATGDAEKVSEVLAAAQEAGIDEVLLNVNFGGISQREALEQLSLLADGVLGQFQAADGRDAREAVGSAAL